MALPNIILKSPGDLVVNNPNQMAGWQEKASLQPTNDGWGENNDCCERFHRNRSGLNAWLTQTLSSYDGKVKTTYI